MRHPSVWSRKHYRGSYAADLWVMDVAAKTFNKLGDPDYKGNYLWPMYAANGEIYFVADRTANEKDIKYGGPEVMQSKNNIWKISDKGGMPTQVTHHGDGNLFFPSISADRQDHRLRGQLRHLEARRRQRQVHRDPHRHQVRRQGERHRAGHSRQ